MRRTNPSVGGHNLYRIRLVILDFLKKKDVLLSEGQSNFLLYIESTVFRIESAIQSGLRLGTKIPKEGKTEPEEKIKTSEDALVDSFKEYEKGLIIASSYTQQILSAINTHLLDPALRAAEYSLLLRDIRYYAEIALEDIQERQHPADEKSEIKAPSAAQHFSRGNPIYKLASILGLGIKPGSQQFEPLVGKWFSDSGESLNPGTCMGRIKDWYIAIATTGTSRTQKLSTVITKYHEEHKTGEVDRDMIGKCIFEDDESNKDVFKVVDRIFSNIENDHVYFIGLTFGKDFGHVIGIRNVPLTNRFELFDPEYGTIFSGDVRTGTNKEDFKVFLTTLISMEYGNPEAMSISLFDMGLQPVTERMTLPSGSSKNPERFANYTMAIFTQVLHNAWENYQLSEAVDHREKILKQLEFNINNLILPFVAQITDSTALSKINTIWEQSKIAQEKLFELEIKPPSSVAPHCAFFRKAPAEIKTVPKAEEKKKNTYP